MINRIKEIAQYFNLSSTAFADRVEIARPVISHIFSERNKPSLEVVQKIGAAFPEIDLHWLLYGQGEMLKRKGVDNENGGKKIDALEDSEESLIAPAPAEGSEPKLTGLPTVAPVPAAGKVNRRTVKIVFIYDDHTFEEFLP